MRLPVLSLLAAFAVTTSTAQHPHSEELPPARSGIPKVVPRAFNTKCWSIVLGSAKIAEPYVFDQHYASDLDRSHPSHWLSSWTLGGPHVWTREPVCIYHDDDSIHCVYTSSLVANGRGISLVATPEQEKSLINVPLFRDASLMASFSDHGDGTTPDAPLRFEQQSLPGKGMGIVATQTIHRGDIIFAEIPIVLVSESIVADAAEYAGDVAIEIAAVRLPTASRALFENLAGSMGGNPYYDRAQTNSFGTTIGDSEEDLFLAIYPDTARINHDCRPNTIYSTDLLTMKQSMVAVRTIYPGEEVTTTYISPYDLHRDRQGSTSMSWGFNCTCNLCTAPAQVISDSDQRLIKIKNLMKELSHVDYVTEIRTQWTDKAELLVSLYQQERLEAFIGVAYAFAAFEYAYIGNKFVTQKYASLASEALMWWQGKWDEEGINEIGLLREDPEASRVWNYGHRMQAMIDDGGADKLSGVRQIIGPVIFDHGLDDVTNNAENDDEAEDITNLV